MQYISLHTQNSSYWIFTRFRQFKYFFVEKTYVEVIYAVDVAPTSDIRYVRWHIREIYVSSI